ncbi:MAG TPA: glycosyltransferase [Thermoanaerobaculia bacterium]|nr:glycosyltransferase [Thermoanaerobaculia bacterium]
MTRTVVIGVRSEEWPSRLPATLASIAANTAEAHEIVVLSDANGAACLNRLFKTTAAPIAVLLESGALVAPRWLEHLLNALRQPGAGLAGPSTNRGWNEQAVFADAGASQNELRRVSSDAQRRFGSTRRTLAPLYSLGDFCYAVKREVFDAIGDADEGYDGGPCWEMDYNIRAARRGFDGLWAGASFVWRAPLSSGRAAREAASFEASRHRYQDKFCGARLRGESTRYRTHCRGDDCPNFAPHATCGNEALPLVTCIMPTFDRRAFVPDAIRGFLAQDYPRRELIVVDDGLDPVANLIPNDPRVSYIRVYSKMTIGAKRNLACEKASGSLIAHWDDDDWYPASRLRVQVDALRERGADICGTSALFFHERDSGRAWVYRYRGTLTPWVAGATLMYRRAFWSAHRFADLSVGEDAQFLWSDRNATVVDLANPSLCVASIHPGNSSRRDVTGECWSPESAAHVRAVIRAGTPRPRVSCVMPTYNRRPFIGLALEAFRRQTYDHRELIVVDDGEDRIEDLVRNQPDVRYVRMPSRASIGAKRNRGVAEASGEIVALWDDDDWYGPERLEKQVAPILSGAAELTGLEDRFVLELPRRRWWTIGKDLHRSMFAGNVTGGTVVFLRSVWTSGVRFPEVSLAEDAAFLREAVRRGLRLARIDEDGLFVYMRHGANTWAFDAGTFLDPRGWREAAAPSAFPPQSLDAYAAAASAQARRPL